MGQTGLPSQAGELPGETEVRLAAYLTERGFAEAVMERIHSLHLHPRKALAWGLFCLANLILLAVLGAAGVYVKGRADAKAKDDLRDLKGFKKTTERMQDADAAMGDDPAVLRDSLRQRDPNKP